MNDTAGRLAGCLVGLAIAATQVIAGPFEDGVAAFDGGDHSRALALWLPLAEAGRPAAQFNVATLYEHGWGVDSNPTEAARWYRAAAQRGDAEAQYAMGRLHEAGTGVARDAVEARRWYGEVIANPRDDAEARAAKERARERLVALPAAIERRIDFDGGRFTVRATPDGDCVVALQGAIGRDTTLAFDRAIGAADAMRCRERWLLLESPGGLLLEGLALGKAVRQQRMHTVTRLDCASACALVFLAGIERRLVGSRARLGFHQAASVNAYLGRRDCAATMDSEADRETRTYLRWVAPSSAERIVALLARTSCDAIAWVQGQEAIDLGVVTHVVDDAPGFAGPDGAATPAR